MSKKLTAKSRRTPILAIILAPVVLLLVVQVWKHALVPLYRSAWHSDTVMMWRLDSDEPAVRIQAARDAGKRGTIDAAIVDQLVARANSDESVEVRKVSATSLGHLGSQQPLGDDAIRALSSLVLSGSDNAMLSTAIVAVGQSAAENRYPDTVIERIAQISGERHREWVYPQATTALGNIGATQPLRAAVFTNMNTRFTEPQNAGERENLATAFEEIAKGQHLPATTLDILAAALEDEPNRRTRQSILNALAYAAKDYPPSIALITAATSDPDQEIVRTAQNALRIVEYNRTLAGKDLLSVATNTSELVETRLNALRIIRSTPIDPAARERIAALAQDSDTDIVVAAVKLLPYMARSVDTDFDQRILIPALSQAMSDSDPSIRIAAYGSLSSISRNRPAYLRAADLPAQLEAGMDDPDPKVRVVVLVMLLRDDKQRTAIIERGMRDPDPNVRQSAAAAQQNRDTRGRAWPIRLWRLWQAGERGKVGMKILVTVTVGTPVLICGVFLLYYMARLLTYLQQRRWRAIALIPVIAAWVAASYGMFMLYFMAAFAGNTDFGETAMLAGLLWGAIAVYTGLGWGMHYAVRR